MIQRTIFRSCMKKLLNLIAFSLVLTQLAYADNGMATATSNGKKENNTLVHFRDCDTCSEMIILPSGKYLMGATKEEFDSNDKDKYKLMYLGETPRHQVEVKSFGLAKFDVTKQQFAEFVNETKFETQGCEIFNGNNSWFDKKADWRDPGFKQTEQDPVVCVSWNDAQKYVAWINSKIPHKKYGNYRLPTEAEWEYATRAGTSTAMYWGNARSEQCKYENARDLSARKLNPDAIYANCDDKYVETAPVGSFQPNPWGFFDMLGNVHKWVSDCSDFGYAHVLSAGVDMTSPDCPIRAMRGASWATIPMGVRSANRAGNKSDARTNSLGFRLAVDLLN